VFLNTFKQYPQRQRPATFTVDQVLEDILENAKQNPPQQR
jgi:hypothetical protein